MDTFAKLQAKHYDRLDKTYPANWLVRRLGFKKLVFHKDWLLVKLLEGVYFRAKASVLDLGCGNGIFLDRLRHFNQGATTFGVDVSLRSLKRGRLEAVKDHFLVNADVTSLPFCRQSFDLVTSFDVMEHVVDQQAMLREAYRILKPGGKAIIYTLSKDNVGTWDWLFDKLGWDYLYRRALHKRELYVDRVWTEKTARLIGFKKIKIVLYHGFFTLNWEILLSLTVLGLERLGLSRLGVAVADWGQRSFCPLFYRLDGLFFRFGWSNGFYLIGEKRG